jgi:hypothetical protein
MALAPQFPEQRGIELGDGEVDRHRPGILEQPFEPVEVGTRRLTVADRADRCE